jgi:Glycosyl hydrolase family 76
MLVFWRVIGTIIALQISFPFTVAQELKLDLGSTGNDELQYSPFGKRPRLTGTASDSIKDVAKQLAASTMREYHGHEPGGTPGLLPGGTNWWEAGALFEQVRPLYFSESKADFQL